MITRSHTKGDAPSTAVYSDCERYRYSLTRVWEPAGRRALFAYLRTLRGAPIVWEKTDHRDHPAIDGHEAA